MIEIGLGVTLISIINFTIRHAIPITLGSMSGILSERSGIVNIGIEGLMLMSAFTGFMMNVALSKPDVDPDLQAAAVRFSISIAVALLTGGALGLLLAILSIQFKVNQIIGGTVINILALGLTGYFYDPEANVPIKPNRLPALIKNNPLPDPFDIELGSKTLHITLIHDLGELLLDKNLITVLTPILVFVLGWALFHTTWGLRTRSVGENPRAADTLGINVYRTQYTNLFLSGMMAGLAGGFLTLAAVPVFEENMTAGRGFIALAVMIFGNWRPSRAFVGALFFGLANALQGNLQQLGIPQQLVSMLPYLLTIIVMAGFVGRVRPPAAEGQVYETE